MFRKKKKKIPEVRAETPVVRDKFDTLDFSRVKDFTSWGQNRVVNDIIQRRMVDVKTREALSKKKEGIDYQKMVMLLIFLAIGGGIAFMVVTNFLNYNDVAKSLSACMMDAGRCGGELAACNVRLENSGVAVTTIKG